MCPLFSLSSFRAATFAVILVPVISPFTIFVSHWFTINLWYKCFWLIALVILVYQMSLFNIALNIYCLCSACMSHSPSSAITILSPILTRRRARDKLDSAATCDGHCKNKSTLTDTSANFTNQPHPLSSPSVQPTSLVTFQATQRFPETTSPHFTFEFSSLSHKLSASDHESSPDPSQPFLITWGSNRIEKNNLQWCNL